jgi:O-antigen/teichoic acid export membrane protein
VGLGLSLLAGRLILGLIYRAEYSDYLDLFIWVMVAGMIGYVASFLNYSMTAARLFQVQIPLFGTLAIVTVLGCLVLIPYFGLSGAALVMSLASSFQIAGSTAILFYTLHKKKPEADPDKTAPGSTSVWSWRAKPRRD